MTSPMLTPEALGKARDALYASRDNGGTMHTAPDDMARAFLAAQDREALAARLAAVTREVRCEPCVGTGEIESSDSTDDSWWDCRRCKGKGVVVKPVTDASGAALLVDALLDGPA